MPKKSKTSKRKIEAIKTKLVKNAIEQKQRSLTNCGTGATQPSKIPNQGTPLRN